MTPTTQHPNLEGLIISPHASIGEAIAHLDKSGVGALALCVDDRRLVGLLTDGDVRRAILNRRSFHDDCISIASLEPITALQPIASVEALRLMILHDVNHLPIVDTDGILRNLVVRRALGSAEELEAAARRRLETVLISPSCSIAEAIAHLDKAGTGGLVLCTDDRVLCGLVTDGDIRRAILRGLSMDSACLAISSRQPVVAPRSISSRQALLLMDEHDIDHLPVIDDESRVLDFLLRKELVTSQRVDLSAVIMAGGYGRRLLPLTESMPKPMLPVGDRPMLELVIGQLLKSGIHDVSLTTHYLPETISNHFGDGNAFGVRLSYVQEHHPMGTAGGLKQMKRPDGPFLVVNGDILTGVPFDDMFAYHRKHGAMLTVGIRKYETQVPFGVVECDDVRITKLKEKPSFSFFINAGTYLLEPDAWDYIPEGCPFDMTDLIQRLIDAGKPVVGFPIIEFWVDVGRHEDYQKVQEYVVSGRI